MTILYHRTTPGTGTVIEAIGQLATGRENTGEVYASTHRDGQATGYGTAVVVIEVEADKLQLDDEFPSGELHYRLAPGDARVIRVEFD